MVEAQHQNSTRKLVDTDAEHAILEDLIERSKPPIPNGPEFARLHWLLSTPLRYPPLRHGSRFGTRSERAIWYGSETIQTALAERAYYRLVVIAGTAARLTPLQVTDTLFQAYVKTRLGVDLAEDPYKKYRSRISSKVSYADSQLLGSEMRASGVEAIRYFSARDPNEAINVGVFSPLAFCKKTVGPSQTWHCTATTSAVEFRRDMSRGTRLVFDVAQFLVRDSLPAPAF